MSWEFFTPSGVQKADYLEDAPSQVGIITSFAGSSAPSGWLICNGQEVSISSYPDLYSVLGQTYGSTTNGSGASGISHFKLPDLRGRAVAGSGSGTGEGSTGTSKITGSSIPPKQIGYWTGVEEVTLTSAESGLPSHNHTFSSNTHTHTASGAHSHTVYGSTVGYETSGGTHYTPSKGGSSLTTGAKTYDAGVSAPTIGSATTGITINSATETSASSSHANRQPYLALNFIIKT